MATGNAWALNVKVRITNFFPIYYYPALLYKLKSSTQLSLTLTALSWAHRSVVLGRFDRSSPVLLCDISYSHCIHRDTVSQNVLHTVKLSQAPLLICVTVSSRAPEVSWRIFMRAVCGAEWSRGVIKVTSRGERSCGSASARACLVREGVIILAALSSGSLCPQASLPLLHSALPSTCATPFTYRSSRYK